MKEYITGSFKETEELGENTGKLLLPGDIVAIRGELGAGKTTFIKGLARGLGISDFVSSPTFIIINEYKGRLPFFHMDLYRMEDIPSINELGLQDYFDKGGVAAIEWAERLGDLCPEKRIDISIEPIDESKRRIVIEDLRQENKGVRS